MAMSGVLARTEKGAPTRVHACGQSVELSTDASGSLHLLRRELVAQLNVSNAASVQLTDSTGKVIQTDQHLKEVHRDGKLPLQAKLTVAALHEIEQKKVEGKSKEQNLLSLQWQVVIEQVASFAEELTNVAGQLQKVKDDNTRAVREYEDGEEIRRQKLLAAVSDESTERKNCQTDLLTKMDTLMQMMIAEQNTREVADYQLAKQTEQVAHELSVDRNDRVAMLAEHSRKVGALRQEFVVEREKGAESWNRSVEMLQRMDQRLEDHAAGNVAHGQRLTTQEGDSERLRSIVNQIHTSMTKTHSDTRANLERHGEEMETHKREITAFHHTEVARLATDHETSWQNINSRIQRVRDEHTKSQSELADRTKILEMRCVALEKELIDRHEADDTNHRTFLDKVHGAATHIEGMQMEHQTREAQVQQAFWKIEELMERMRTVESSLDCTVGTDHWKAQVEGMATMSQKTDMKVAKLEREIQQRFAQEGTHREEMKANLQGAMRNAVDKLTDNKGEESKRSRDMLSLQRNDSSGLLALQNPGYPVMNSPNGSSILQAADGTRSPQPYVMYSNAHHARSPSPPPMSTGSTVCASHGYARSPSPPPLGSRRGASALVQPSGNPPLSAGNQQRRATVAMFPGINLH